MSRSPWVAHFGFSTTPFTKSIAARDLFGRGAHDEAVARIGFVIAESSLGVITGEVGVGKTVALRAAVASLDPLRHHLIYLSNPPALGTRGNWRGQPLTSYEVIVDLIGSTTTRSGLNVRAELDQGSYPKGVKISDSEFAEVERRLVPDAFHGEWNYSIKPERSRITRR